ncbi:2705_t:CDS:2, partial [Gigaspora rosea]
AIVQGAYSPCDGKGTCIKDGYEWCCDFKEKCGDTPGTCS